MRRLLVDTNVVFWMLVSDEHRLTKEARRVLEDDQASIYASAASVLEIAIKRSLGRLQLSDQWARTIPRLGLEALPVTALHAESVEHLPRHHRDPFDRLLVAQARVEEMALVSADEQLSAYDVDVIW